MLTAKTRDGLGQLLSSRPQYLRPETALLHFWQFLGVFRLMLQAGFFEPQPPGCEPDIGYLLHQQSLTGFVTRYTSTVKQQYLIRHTLGYYAFHTGCTGLNPEKFFGTTPSQSVDAPCFGSPTTVVILTPTSCHNFPG